MPHLTTVERVGIRKGRKEGRLEGRHEGRQEGVVLGVQESILDMVEMRQGSVTSPVAEQISAISDLELLRGLRKLLMTDAPFAEFELALKTGDLA